MFIQKIQLDGSDPDGRGRAARRRLGCVRRLAIIEGFDPQVIVKFKDTELDGGGFGRPVAINRPAKAERPSRRGTICFHLTVALTAGMCLPAAIEAASLDKHVQLKTVDYATHAVRDEVTTIPSRTVGVGEPWAGPAAQAGVIALGLARR